MPEFMKWLIELGASLVPLLTVRFFSFLNPKIVDEVWGGTIVVMLLAGFVVYFLSRLTVARPHPWILGVTSAGVSVLCYFALLSLSRDMLGQYPELSALLARCCFVAFFAGFSGTLSELFRGPRRGL
jgi:hypothetical protein